MDNHKLYKFSPSELRQLQLKELETLVYFKDFCEKHELRFFFCGGCCIGTLRNKGFIPWDDDIDIFMPRADYERMIRLWQDSERFVLLQTGEKMFTGNLFATVVDKSATCVKDYQADLNIPHGLVMDVFPLDGCPQGAKRKIQKFWALIYSLYRAQIVPKNHGKLLAFGSNVLLKMVPSKKLRLKIWKFAEKQMSKYSIDDCEYITELCTGPHYMQNEYPKQIFSDVVYKGFEGLQMPIPIGYDEYLHIAFGDYMRLPEKSKQVPHHDVVLCDLQHDCSVYDRRFSADICKKSGVTGNLAKQRNTAS